MASLTNHALAKMRAGGIALVATVNLVRSGDICRLMAAAGLDVLVLDLEHQVHWGDAVHEIAMTGLDVGITVLARPGGPEYTDINRGLNSGALGVIVPRVASVADARAVVQAARFAPAGARAVPPILPHFGFRAYRQAEALAALDAQTLVAVNLESAEAIRDAEAIAAVPGIDVLFIGAGDLAQSLGLAERDHPTVWAALEQLVAACKRHGKFAGLGGLMENAQLERAVSLGVQYLSIGSDTSFLLAGAKAKTGVRYEFLRP
jgi:2-keto-3-deoxy-L-rhamnonate aldolase RhmA